ncbi:plasmid mobilization relaxosome protein MobC [Paracoccus sp. J55]|uniref:plasmid mobilization protein n=1 Tax=Paracoccus sp. J55 TaxID=935849 RepID=UPI000561EBCD|nr:plasmid mobilization relaxosome protein MobC [Paracoccus sp. J55]
MIAHKMKRDRILQVPLTDPERAEIKGRADALGLPVAAYMRSVVLGVEPPARRAGVDAEAVAALNRVGSNLNQIARACNAKGTLNPVQIKALGVVLTQVKQTSTRIGEALA